MPNIVNVWSEDLLVIVLVSLLIGPVIFFLFGPWVYRRQEIMEGLSAESVKLYFDTFHPGLGQTPAFVQFYNARFGRRWYILPILMLTTTGGIVAACCVNSVFVALKWRTASPASVPLVAVMALTGSYMWVIGDLLTRWRFRDVSPTDLWWSSWRLVIAVPLAYAVGALLAANLALPVAFLLGAFPSRQVSTLARRLARRQLNLGADADESGESELEKLQSIDTRIAERFADEGITTIVQLAYADPVELTMRCASFAFSFVIDCQSQALAWIYLGDMLVKLRPWSLRGAQEIANLVSELDGKDRGDADVAKETIERAAVVVGIDPTAFRRTLGEIGDDPYTLFINTVWSADAEGEDA